MEIGGKSHHRKLFIVSFAHVATRMFRSLGVAQCYTLCILVHCCALL